MPLAGRCHAAAGGLRLNDFKILRCTPECVSGVSPVYCFRLLLFFMFGIFMFYFCLGALRCLRRSSFSLSACCTLRTPKKSFGSLLDVFSGYTRRILKALKASIERELGRDEERKRRPPQIRRQQQIESASGVHRTSRTYNEVTVRRVFVLFCMCMCAMVAAMIFSRSVALVA